MPRYFIGQKILYMKHKKNINCKSWNHYIGNIYTINSFCTCYNINCKENREISLKEIGAYYTDENGVVPLTKLSKLLYHKNSKE